MITWARPDQTRLGLGLEPVAELDHPDRLPVPAGDEVLDPLVAPEVVRLHVGGVVPPRRNVFGVEPRGEHRQMLTIQRFERVALIHVDADLDSPGGRCRRAFAVRP